MPLSQPLWDVGIQLLAASLGCVRLWIDGWQGEGAWAAGVGAEVELGWEEASEEEEEG